VSGAVPSPIVGNDWSVLVPDPDATWTPQRRVSICIPTRDPGAGLVRTLRCLAAQTYPAELIEIVIADDGSEVPIAVPDGLAHDVRVVRQERTAGFGAGRARNLAGSAASGDILFFLDADVIPERQVVESYTRWFEGCELATPLGLCRFVDVDDLGDDALFDLVHSGGMEAHFAGLDVDDQTWRERHFERLDDLRIESIDAFRVTIGATLAVSAAQFHDVGGFPELGVRGVEDTAFGYRIHNNGGVLILDRDAVHWHQGRRNLSMGRRQDIDRVRAPYVESVIPVRGFRRGQPPADPPVPPVPIVRVHVFGDGPDADVTRRSVAGDGSGNVALGERNDDLRDVFRAYDDALVQVVLPPGAVWSDTTTALILDVFAQRDVGVIRVVDDDGMFIDVARTRAVRRAVQVCPDDEPFATASKLFGVWWVDCGALAISGRTASTPAADVDVRTSGHSPEEWFRRVVLWTYDQGTSLLRRAAR
jgi:glycosyltransferase involved in cell wall biosynthesis